jgi:hypothetical protein
VMLRANSNKYMTAKTGPKGGVPYADHLEIDKRSTFMPAPTQPISTRPPPRAQLLTNTDLVLHN